MLPITNFDLLTVGVAVAGILILGFTIFFNGRHNSTNRAFFFFSLFAAMWTLTNYAQHVVPNIALSFWLLRFVIFTAVWLCVSFLWLFYVIPEAKKDVPKWFKMYVFPTASLVAILTLSPLVFQRVSSVEDGVITGVENGPGIILFGVTVVALVIAAIFSLARKIIGADSVTKNQLGTVLWGFLITFFLLLTFNFFLPAFLGIPTFVSFGGLYLLPFVIFTSFSIYKNKLFNIKVALTAVLVFAICMAIFIETIFATDITIIGIKIAEFLLVLVTGILLIKSVLKEVHARDEIAALAEKLSSTNLQLEESNDQLRIIDLRKSEFVSIVSHQLRTPITAIKGYTSLILEESFGPITEQLKAPVQKIFSSSSRLAQMVSDYLDISKIEQGTMSYTFSPVDIGAMIRDLGDDFVQVAAKKGLGFSVHIPEGRNFIATADDGKIRQIFSNLIDNSIKYTPTGKVELYVDCDDEKGTVFVKIVDTGIGLSQEDIHHLFGKFTRGSEGQRQNTEGSGLGLYVARKMLEAQKGTVWVDSEGPGKGSTFCVELTGHK